MTNTRKNFHVEVNGERIASFVLLEDALFFARTGDEQGFFGDTTPFVSDSRGNSYGFTPTPYNSK